MALGEFGDAYTQGKERKLYAVPGLGLGAEVADVSFDGGHGEPEFVADFLVGSASGDESEDVVFSGCEFIHEAMIGR